MYWTYKPRVPLRTLWNLVESVTGEKPVTKLQTNLASALRGWGHVDSVKRRSSDMEGKGSHKTRRGGEGGDSSLWKLMGKRQTCNINACTWHTGARILNKKEQRVGPLGFSNPLTLCTCTQHCFVGVQPGGPRVKK